MPNLTLKKARDHLIGNLQDLGYVLERQYSIDFYFRCENHVAVAQISSHLGLLRLGLVFALDHHLTNELIEAVRPAIKIWNVRQLPHFHCPIIEPYSTHELDDDEVVEDIVQLYHSGEGRPRIPRIQPVNLTMIIPREKETGLKKISAAVNLHDLVFESVLPEIDNLLPTPIPAWFLCNSAPIGDAIVMLARAVELNLGEAQLHCFEQFMIEKHGRLGNGATSDGWNNALPILKEFIKNRRLRT
jgi:hypothetical protein